MPGTRTDRPRTSSARQSSNGLIETRLHSCYAKSALAHPPEHPYISQMKKFPEPHSLFKQRLIDGAYAYAAFDRSDPFALPRALMHIRSAVGLDASPDAQRTLLNEPAYGATRTTEMRIDQRGAEYPVVVYKNAHRA